MASIPSVGAGNQQANTIEKIPSQSSFIAELEYNSAMMLLTTTLKNGSIYQHFFVLQPEWNALKTSQNHGRHWATQIKGKHLSMTVKANKSPVGKLRHPQQNP